jgi:hypothetical protein
MLRSLVAPGKQGPVDLYSYLFVCPPVSGSVAISAWLE